MISIKELDHMIEQTINKHNNPDFCLANLFLYMIDSEFAEEYKQTITRNNDAREIAKKTTPTEILELISKEIVKIYNTGDTIKKFDPDVMKLRSEEEKLRLVNQKCPYYNEIERSIIEKLRQPNAAQNVIINENLIIEMTAIVFSYRYTHNKHLKKVIDKYGEFGEKETFANIEKSFKDIAAIKNVKVNNKVINKCYEDLIEGKQLLNQRNQYIIEGNLTATQDIGKRKTNQEDSVLIMTHPQNQEFKLLAVADGVGGEENSEEASKLTLEMLAKWFERIPAKEYNNPKILEKFKDIIRITNNIIVDKCNKGATTFCGAIIGENETYILNVGDSRAYIIKDNNTKLVTVDESVIMGDLIAQNKNYTAQDIDSLRFKQNSHMIYRCLGNARNLTEIKHKIINNNEYDRLVVMTDGVSDLLDHERIQYISNNSPLEKFTENLVNEAITKDAINPNYDINSEDIMLIRAGKDNATAAAVENSRGRRL